MNGKLIGGHPVSLVVRPERDDVGRGYTQYNLPESGRDEWVLFSAFIDYRLADGTKLHILQTEAWCSACARFVVAEEIPSISALESEIAKIESGDEETVKVWTFVSNGQPVSNRIAELRERIEWRHARKNPPRCLECGGFDIIMLPHGDEFAHPVTGERVLEVSAGWADTEPWHAEFSPEGERLAEQTDEREPE